jgi:hypothetical protein
MLVYLVNKPQVLEIIVRLLLLFLEYDFTGIYKLGKTHVIVDALSRLPDTIGPIGVSEQTIDANLFFIEP